MANFKINQRLWEMKHDQEVVSSNESCTIFNIKMYCYFNKARAKQKNAY